MRVGASSRRPGWTTVPVVSVAGLSVGSGIAAFGVTAVIGDVAAAFGRTGTGAGDLADIGVPVTTVGIALAVVRLASLGSLPLAALADRVGRRQVLLVVAGFGFAATALAAAAPGFWWYVAMVTVARPALATVNSVAGVVAAEETRSQHRAAAIALVTAGYGLGSGLVSVGRGLLGEPSFRVVTAFALAPLLLLPLLARGVREPAIASERRRGRGFPGAVPARVRGRVALLAALVGGIAVATGPGFTYLFVYGERVLRATPLEVAILVLAAGPVGLLGILAGRWGADRLGRRVTGGVAMAGTGLGVALAYSGTFAALAVGYLLTILLASAFAPAQGSLASELVPTAVRATVAGWLAVAGVLGAVAGLLAFGVLADVTGSFAAAAWLGVLVAAGALGFLGLPETRGTELEDLEEDAVP